MFSDKQLYRPNARRAAVTSDLQLICLHPPELCAWTAHARVRGRVTLAVPLPVCKEGIYWPIHLSTCGHAVLTINEYPDWRVYKSLFTTIVATRA